MVIIIFKQSNEKNSNNDNKKIKLKKKGIN